MKRRAASSDRRQRGSRRNQLAELDHLYETVPVGLCLLDRELRYLRVNERLAEINGKPVSVHLGRTIGEVLPEIAPTLEPMLRRVIETGEPVLNLEVSATTLAEPGVERQWLNNYSPLIAEDGTVEGISCVAQEITARRGAEEAQRRSIERYRTLVETIPHGVEEIDTSGIITVANLAHHKQYEYGEGELIGASILDLVATDSEREELRNYLKYLVKEQPTPTPYFGKKRTKNGRVIDVEVTWNYTRDTHGQLMGFTSIITDISERKRAEEALKAAHEDLERRVRERTEQLVEVNVTLRAEMTGRQEAESSMRENQERFRRLLETTRVIPWEASAETWQFTYVGPQAFELLGYPIDQWYEKDFWVSHIHPDDGGYAVNFCLESSARLKDYEFEYRMVSSNGSVVWFHDIVTVESVDGLPKVLRGFMVDITERKQREEALHYLSGRLINSQEEGRRRLARELHDDLAQRLAVLAIEAGKLEQELRSSPDLIHRRLQGLREETVKLSVDVHRMSRQLHPSILDDLGLVQAIQSECSRFSEREGILAEFVPESIPEAIPKEVSLSLYRVAQEALRNVAKHARARKARITLAGFDGGVLLSIEDSGLGFDPAQVKGKAGLGLESMEERVRLIRARMSVHSAPGQGTTIKVWVPMAGRDG